uniref:hypothetical protein n=1 Tax=Vibrio sp. S12_S33 TaxID=2720223 RepID=UPI001EE1DCC7
LIVLRPVSYLLFRFPHVITALTITKDQIAGLGKGSTDLGNNAVIICSSIVGTIKTDQSLKVMSENWGPLLTSKGKLLILSIT